MVKYLNQHEKNIHTNTNHSECMNLRLPYNWKSPITYSITVAFQTLTIIFSGITWISVLMIFIGFCSFGIAFVDDIELNLREIFDYIPVRSPHMRIKMKENLHDSIRFHAEAKQ